jgi:hypothetical protein
VALTFAPLSLIPPAGDRAGGPPDAPGAPDTPEPPDAPEPPEPPDAPEPPATIGAISLFYA